MEMCFAPSGGGLLIRARAGARPRRVRPATCMKASEKRSGFNILSSGLPFQDLVRVARWTWHRGWLVLMDELAPSGPDGSYKRPPAQRRREDSREAFPAEAGRYVLYAGVACPWCHRVLIALQLVGDSSIFPVAWLVPGDGGLWDLEDKTQGQRTLRDVYQTSDPAYKGRSTAPVLIDSVTGKVICNESIDILRMLYEEFEGLREEQREVCDDISENINNGVYKAGFAKNQSAYEASVRNLVNSLDRVEKILAGQRFLSGQDSPGMADVILFPTVFRFDSVYAPLFHCSVVSIRHEYPAIMEWARDMYQLPGIAAVSDLETTAHNYFENLFPLNPSGIVPVAPRVDFSTPAKREFSQTESAA